MAETSSNPVAAPPEVAGGEGTMADAMKSIDAAPTKLEQKLSCVCLNKTIDLENPQVRAGLGVAVFVGLVIFLAPLLSMASGGSAAPVRPPSTGSGYGGCSTASTRRELAQLTRSASGNTGVCVGGAPDGSDTSTCAGDVIQVFPL